MYQDQDPDQQIRDDFTHLASKREPQATWFAGNLDAAQSEFVSSYAQCFCVLDIAPVKNIPPLADGRALFILQIFIEDTKISDDRIDLLLKSGDRKNIEYIPYIGHISRLERGSDGGLPLHTWLLAEKQPAITLVTGHTVLDTTTPLTQFYTSHGSSGRFKVEAGDPFADFFDLVGDEAARRAQWKIIADAKYPVQHFPTALDRLTHRLGAEPSHASPTPKRKIK